MKEQPRSKYKTPVKAEKPLTPQSVVERLKNALRSDGDFPVRAKIVNELRTLVNNPNAQVDKITEVILREPALGTRVLHMVNSAFYQRRQPIMTVTQAVMQIGMRALSDLCAGLVLMQKFIPAAQRGGIFAEGLRKSILTSLITSTLVAEKGDASGAERGYLAGTFYNLGYLLLSYYFPQVYETAEKRAMARNLSVTQSVAEVIGIGPLELSLEVVESLQIPQYYRDVLTEAKHPFKSEHPPGANTMLAHALQASAMIADAMGLGGTREILESTLNTIAADTAFSRELLDSMILKLPGVFEQHCQLIEIDFLTLPEFVINYSALNVPGEPVPPAANNGDEEEEGDKALRAYLDDIRQAISLREPLSSIITAAMEVMTFALGFDRALLLMADDERRILHGKMVLGHKVQIDPKTIHRELASGSAHSPDIKAFKKGSCEIFGDPLFKDGWPFAALAVGNASSARGVIYADRLTLNGEEQPLDEKTQAALSILVDLLEQAVRTNH